MNNRKDIINLSAIFLIEVALVLICVLGLGSFVMTGDYTYQHGVFPDVFRQEFYDTGKLLPDCIFQLGGGQNIYNFSYYGLLSPVVLLSYLFPFVDMMIFMQLECVFMFISIGILMYIWMRKHYTETESLIAALLVVVAPPILYGFQNQVVFVECLPFVLLSLIAADRKLETGRNGLLIISMTLMIMVNYYSSIMSLACIMTYYGYRYLTNNRKVTVKAVWAIVRPVIVSILISGVLLIPSAYVILNGIRVKHHELSFAEKFIIPDYLDLYKPYGMGLTMVFVFVAVAILINSRKIIAEKFLSIILIVMTFSPIVLYILNGGNYIRNKTAIPMWPLWSLLFILVYRKMKQNTLKYKISFVLYCIFGIIILMCDIERGNVSDIMSKTFYFTLIAIDMIVTALAIIICRFTSKKWVFAVFTIIQMLVLSIGLSVGSIHMKELPNDSLYSSVVDEILQDNDSYRIGNNIRQQYNINKVYSDKYLTTSIYTSTQNKYYWEFYARIWGNNDYYRNYLMLGGAHNPLFNTYMGTKYLIDDYQLIDKDYNYLYSKEGVNVYKNDNAFPLIYGKKDSVSMDIFNQLPYPYSIDCLMNNVITVYEELDEAKINNIVDEAKLNKDLYDSGRIKPYNSSNVKSSYKFKQEESQEYTIQLSNPVINKYLIIEFKIKQQENSDLRININDSRNLLSAQTAVYDNKNYTFRYVLSSDKQLDELKVYIKEGEYDISDVKLYTYDLDIANIEMDEAYNINFDHSESSLSATINITDSEYLVTSLPYDEGYTIYIDGKEAKKEILNTAFLGCKIEEGKHDIEIVYRAPWKKAGMACTAIGIILLLAEIVVDIKHKKK